MATTQPTSVRLQLWIVAFAFFMQALDTTIVNTALPAMARALNQAPGSMHLIIVSYVLTVAVMLPACGWLADKAGVRNILVVAIVLFTIGSLLCALSQTLHQLVMARVVQGIGGAMMVPVGRLTVLKIVPRDQYMAAMAFVTLPGQIGPLIGPVLGGVLVEYVSWHWIFLINIPVGIIGVIATFMLMPNYRMQTRRFDLPGFAMLSLAMAILTVAFDGHGAFGFSWSLVGALVLTGLLLLGAYVYYARGKSGVLFPLRLFRLPSFSLGLAGSLAGRIGSGMLPFLIPLYLQTALGYSPATAGMMMIPMVLGNMGMKRFIVTLVNRFGYRRVLVVTTVGLALGILLFLPAARYHNPLLVVLVLFLTGMINSARFTSMNTLTLKDLPDPLVSSGNSLLSMIMQIAAGTGVSLAGVMLGYFLKEHASLSLAEVQYAFAMVWSVTALVLFLPVFVFLFVPGEVKIQRKFTAERKHT